MPLFEPKKKKTDALVTVLEERNFQEEQGADPDKKNMKPVLSVGETITAINYNMQKAEQAWYIGAAPHPDAMKYLRKVCALALQAGENFGFPKREK